jgi:hypothetical protein
MNEMDENELMKMMSENVLKKGKEKRKKIIKILNKNCKFK